MEIISTTVKVKDLKPGDLFSSVGPLYWQHHKTHKSVGEKVYIRTDAPSPEHQLEDEIYKITIIR